MLSRSCSSSIRIELARRYLKEGKSSGWNHDDERWNINTKIRSLEDKTSGCTLLGIALKCGDPVFKKYLTNNGATEVKPSARSIFRSTAALQQKLRTIDFNKNLV